MGVEMRIIQLMSLAVLAPLFCCQSTNASVIRLGSDSGVILYSTAQPTGIPGYIATIVEARTEDPDERIQGISSLSFYGAVQQIWPLDENEQSPSLFGPGGPTDFYHERWNTFDSHLLINEAMIRESDLQFLRTSEENDGTLDDSRLELPNATPSDVPPVVGFGDIFTERQDGLFLLKEPSNSVPIAYLVQPIGVEGVTPGIPCAPKMCRVRMNARIFLEGSFGQNAAIFDDLSVSFPPVVPEPSANSLVVLATLFGVLFRRRAKNG